MRQLPTGTVTFLFTDIEGSTRLLHELGAERYAGALAEHRRVLREAFDRHGGVEVDTQGDAFFAAFPTAPGALEAAADALAGLASGPIHVRAGIHTGTPLLGEEGYVGVDVHRAARIAACGHGGQVLVSASTAALTGTQGLRDLGEHRLKDLSAPERLYQLGDGDFPTPKSLYRTNLPIPATPFLGREHELAEVIALLEGARLLTLTGPGGAGKTRLALQAAADASDRYPDGLFWVPLSPLRDPELVLETAARVLGARTASPSTSPTSRRCCSSTTSSTLSRPPPGWRSCWPLAPTCSCSSRAGSCSAFLASRHTLFPHSSPRTEPSSSSTARVQSSLGLPRVRKCRSFAPASSSSR